VPEICLLGKRNKLGIIYAGFDVSTSVQPFIRVKMAVSTKSADLKINIAY